MQMRKRTAYSDAEDEDEASPVLPLPEHEQEQLVEDISKQHDHDVRLWKLALGVTSLGVLLIVFKELPRTRTQQDVYLLTCYLVTLVVLLPPIKDALLLGFAAELSPIIQTFTRPRRISIFSPSIFICRARLFSLLPDTCALVLCIMSVFNYLATSPSSSPPLLNDDDPIIQHHPILIMFLQLLPCACLGVHRLALYWDKSGQRDISFLDSLRYSVQ